MIHVSTTYPSDGTGAMRKKLTITIASEVYEGLYREIGAGRISAFIEHLVRPYVVPEALDSAYAAMAADEAREGEALEWAEGLVGDSAHDPR
jgi:predicted CopG family antitoxin